MRRALGINNQTTDSEMTGNKMQNKTNNIVNKWVKRIIEVTSKITQFRSPWNVSHFWSSGFFYLKSPISNP